MKKIRATCLATLLVLLMLGLSVTPVMPARADTTPTPTPPTLTLSPKIAHIGDHITVSGSGFNKSTDTLDRHLALFLSGDAAERGETIGTKVTHYAQVPGDIILDTDGAFSSFDLTIPALLEHDNPATVTAVTSGTYYVYACYYSTSVPPEIAKAIIALDSLTVNAGKLTLSNSRGIVGSPLNVSGTNFLTIQPLAVKFDSINLNIEQGDTMTTATGSFTSTVSVPPTTSGAHNLTVTIGGSDVNVTFVVDPDVTISPPSGLPGAPVIVSGNGFGRSKPFTVSLNGVPVAAGTTNILGSLLISFSVPAAQTPGQYEALLADADGNAVKSQFLVPASTSPTPTTPTPSPTPTPTPPPTPMASVSPATGHIGSAITIIGGNFKAGAIVTIKYDGTPVANATVDSKGSFAAVFQAPPGRYGQYIINASDGTNSLNLTFVIESVTPDTPTLTAPADHAAVKTVNLEWNAVSDEDTPVTYDLQVSADNGFASPLVDRKGLTASDYTPTQDEIKKLSAGQPYYWRVRAVDAASNESDWSAVRDFTISGPMLPAWVVYVLIGIGGLLLLILGMVLGRRTSGR